MILLNKVFAKKIYKVLKNNKVFAYGGKQRIFQKLEKHFFFQAKFQITMLTHL